MNKNKIALGTAQFGMDYGICNKKGKIPKNEVFEILNESSKYGIDVLDTAYVYGDSELVIGDFIREHRIMFNIISKLPECNPEDVMNKFESSLERLASGALYGYMCHNFQHCRNNPEIWNILEELKSEGKVKKIGFSLYYPSELEHIIEKKMDLDIVQVPYNIFDQRFEQYFPLLKNTGVEIHVRSVFLQGLVFKEPSELDEHFEKIKEKIVNLHSLSMKLNIPVAALCLNFAVLNKFVDKVVVGVDSLSNLKEIVSSSEYLTNFNDTLKILYSFREDDENMILPIKWKVAKK